MFSPIRLTAKVFLLLIVSTSVVYGNQPFELTEAHLEGPCGSVYSSLASAHQKLAQIEAGLEHDNMRSERLQSQRVLITELNRRLTSCEISNGLFDDLESNEDVEGSTVAP